MKFERYELLELFDQENFYNEEDKGQWSLKTPEGYSFTLILDSPQKKAQLILKDSEFEDPLFDVELTELEIIAVKKIKNVTLLRFYKKPVQVFNGSTWADMTQSEPFFEITVRPHVSFSYDFV